MIILDTTNKSLQIVLSGAITTNQLPFVATYADITTTTMTAGEQDGASNSTTPVTCLSSPASSTQRQLKFLSVYNADTAAATVTLTYNDNSTLRTIGVWPLSIGYTLNYNLDSGFTVLPASAAGQYDTQTASTVQVYANGGPATALLTATTITANNTTKQSADIINYNGKGLTIYFNCTATNATASINIAVQGKDAVTGNYCTLVNTLAMAGVLNSSNFGTLGYWSIYPGLTANTTSGACTSNMIVPRTFRIQVNSNITNNTNATGYSYTVGYCLQE